MNNEFRFVKVIVILFLFLSATVFLFWSRDYTQETLKLDTSVLSTIKESGINEKDLLYERRARIKKGGHSYLKIVRHYEVGSEFDADSFLATIKQLLKRSKFKLAKSVFEKEGQDENFIIFLSFKNKILYSMKFLKKRSPRISEFESTGAKIAIVLDDFGYNMNNTGALFKINSPLTISVLPTLPYSKKIATQARKRNFEIILHLPLEPYSEELNLEEGTIMVDMPPQKVNALLTKAIESVPGLKGVSNHMGSRATEDSDFMKELFKELKKRDLYFLDNLVTDKSVCKEVAKSMGLQIVTRSVFLDNESDESYIEKQIFHTADLAAKTGWAIGIGHDKSRTVKVLAKVIPQLEKEGFEFVYVSDLVR